MPERRLDKTSPTISGSRTQVPNDNGWNNGDVTIHFEASDSLTGIESITLDITISKE